MPERRIDLASFLAGTETGSSGEPDEAIMDRLHQVIDPELGVNVVDLGLVYGAWMADGGVARVRMTTTTPACPIGDYLTDQIRWALLDLPTVLDVAVEITHEPPWSPARMSDVARAQLGWPA